MAKMIWGMIGLMVVAAQLPSVAEAKPAAKAAAKASKNPGGYTCRGTGLLAGTTFRLTADTYFDGRGQSGKYEQAGDWGTFVTGPFEGYYAVRQPDGRLGINNNGSKNYEAMCVKG